MLSESDANPSGPTAQTVASWNRQLRESMGACWAAHPPAGLNPTVSYRLASVGDFSLFGITVPSPMSYSSTPHAFARAQHRLFFVHMGNAPNRMRFRGQDLIQQPGECMLGDSFEPTSSACWRPHSTLCAGFPAGLLQHYLPNAEAFVGKHLDRNSSYARIVPKLLTSLYRTTSTPPGADGGALFSYGLVRAFARWCAISGTDDHVGERISYEQIRRTICARIHDPDLTVEAIAEQHGVSTRYLQQLFARRDDCISACIRRERLRGCVLDLKDVNYSARSITDIAFSWGFNSASHFSATFKKEYGLTARDYRYCSGSQVPSHLKERLPGLLAIASEQLVG